MTNTERQREFRERNPGYYGRLHRQRKADMLALRAAMQAAEAAVPARAEPLMLPAPAELILIPGVNAIPASLEALYALRDRQAAAVAVAERDALSPAPNA